MVGGQAWPSTFRARQVTIIGASLLRAWETRQLAVRHEWHDALAGAGLSKRTLSPWVMHRWAWCKSRSTVAVANVLGMQFIEACRMDVVADGDAAALVGGVDQAVQTLSRVRT